MPLQEQKKYDEKNVTFEKPKKDKKPDDQKKEKDGKNNGKR